MFEEGVNVFRRPSRGRAVARLQAANGATETEKRPLAVTVDTKGRSRQFLFYRHRNWDNALPGGHINTLKSVMAALVGRIKHIVKDAAIKWRNLQRKWRTGFFSAAMQLTFKLIASICSSLEIFHRKIITYMLTNISLRFINLKFICRLKNLGYFFVIV